MMDDRNRFFRQWWQAAFSPAWRHGRNVSFVVTVAGGAVAYLNPDLHKALAIAASLAPLRLDSRASEVRFRSGGRLD